MNFIKIIVFTVCLCSIYDECAGTAVCPDTTWTGYDVHCYKQTVGVVNTEAEAKTKCAQMGSSAIPVTVHNDADNNELAQFLATVSDTSFYIGLEFKAGEWDWLDSGNTKTYQLWDKTTDPSDPKRPCAQIDVVTAKISGWITNDCKQQVQSVVCQTPSPHSLDDLYNEVQKLKAQIGKGTVPVGFIYVQLPGQKAPAVMWPKPIVWEDMTTTYAGLFFRAEGAGSAVFNTTGVTKQTASLFTTFNITAKGLSGVSYNLQLTQTRVTPINEETLSGEIVPGDVVNSLKVLIDDRNAHPINTAVKIWRRRT